MGVKTGRFERGTYKRETKLQGSLSSRDEISTRACFLDALNDAVDVGRVIAETVVVLCSNCLGRRQ